MRMSVALVVVDFIFLICFFSGFICCLCLRFCARFCGRVHVRLLTTVPRNGMAERIGIRWIKRMQNASTKKNTIFALAGILIRKIPMPNCNAAKNLCTCVGNEKKLVNAPILRLDYKNEKTHCCNARLLSRLRCSG